METRVKITTHDGKEFVTTIVNYDAVTLAQMLNGTSGEFIPFGRYVLFSHTVKYVEPIEEEEVEGEEN